LYDINATVNSNLNGQPTCLGGRKWYLGYDGNEGIDLELLPVVLHELGHGLGFSTLVNSSGFEAGGLPDIYERHIRDNVLGSTWDQMSDGQRAASAINTGNVVWDGPCANLRSGEVLGFQPTCFVNAGSPPAQPKYPTGTASFGPLTFNITADLVLVNDGAGTVTDGCEPFAGVAGKIALIDRGTCNFSIKAANAQAAGAIGVIIANNVASANPPGLGGTDPTITIPVVSVTLAAGNDLKSALLAGSVNVTLAPDPSVVAGADDAGRVKLYAPNPYEGGSSISHWDVTAFPNLLMEPAINTDLHNTVDLALSHFTDIGWLAACGVPPTTVAITAFDARATAGGVELIARFYSTLGAASFVTIYRADGGSESFSGIATLEAPSNGNFSYLDETALPGRSYRYQISVIDADGEFFSPTEEVTMPKARIELAQNAPNPFNPSTTIRFTLPVSERVGLAIYSASGALVRMLVDETRERGSHDVSWDGRDSAGNPVSSGVYFYRLTAGKFSDSRKMVLLK
ncbi:MAG TPA: PA domain-containing protein, partial [Candidatus Krumholzibacteria bacterium]|nr:PA domain-containing protein [Candidatus Krumholzibacteria bacterium]